MPSASSRSPWLCENEWQSLTLPVPPPPFLSTSLSVLVVGGRGFKDKIRAVTRASVCLCLRETESMWAIMLAQMWACYKVSPPSRSLWYQISLIKHQWSPSVSQSPRTLPRDRRDDNPILNTSILKHQVRYWRLRFKCLMTVERRCDIIKFHLSFIFFLHEKASDRLPSCLCHGDMRNQQDKCTERGPLKLSHFKTSTDSSSLLINQSKQFFLN